MSKALTSRSLAAIRFEIVFRSSSSVPAGGTLLRHPTVKLIAARLLTRETAR
jgi:hypothetical protein